MSSSGERNQHKKDQPMEEVPDAEDLITFNKRNFHLFLISIFVIVATVSVTLGGLTAKRGQILEDEDDDSFDSSDGSGEAVPFSSIKFFFELNDSDNDLGVQMNLGADPWKKLAIKNPQGSTILNVEAAGVLQQHGMSDLVFESAEPQYATEDEAEDEDGKPLITKTEIFKRFPPGTYTFLGYNTEGQLLRGEATLTHDIPEAVEITSPVEGAVIPALQDLTVMWETVTVPTGIQIHSYEVIVTNQDDEDFVLDMRVPGTITKAIVPASFLEEGVQYELEVLAREVSGNQVITIVFFTIEG